MKSRRYQLIFALILVAAAAATLAIAIPGWFGAEGPLNGLEVGLRLRISEDGVEWGGELTLPSGRAVTLVHQDHVASGAFGMRLPWREPLGLGAVRLITRPTLDAALRLPGGGVGF